MAETLFEVRDSPISGKGLFATQDLAPYTRIHVSQRPLIYAVDSLHVARTCSYCFKTNTPPSITENEALPAEIVVNKACTGCGYLRFCSKKCQTHAWARFHKYECKHIKRNSLAEKGPIGGGDDCLLRMLAQWMVLRKNGQLSAEELAELDGLHHYAGFKNPIQAHVTSELALRARRIWGVESSYTDRETMEMLNKIKTNAFQLDSGDGEIVGGAVFPLVHFLNHSCGPNVLKGSNGAKSELIVCDRPVLRGKELFVAYRPASDPFPRRQAVLKQRYGFVCACVKCKLGNASPESRFPDARGKVSSDFVRGQLASAQAHGKEFQSTEYPIPTPSGTLSRPDEAIYTSLSLLQTQAYTILDRTSTLSSPPSETASLLSLTLKLLFSSSIWPPAREPYPQLFDALISAEIAAQTLDSALKHAVFRYFKIDPHLHPDPRAPERILNNRILMKLLLHEGAGEASFKFPFDMAVVGYNLSLEIVENLDGYFKADHVVAREERKKFEQMKWEITEGRTELLELLGKSKAGEWLKFEKYGSAPSGD